MANRLTISIPTTQIDRSVFGDSQLAADQLPAIAQGLLGALFPEQVADATGQAEAEVATEPPRVGVSAAPMAAAPFVWRADGRPDWGVMWTSFCDLALYGGPPHRPLDQAVRMLPGTPPASPELDATRELQRGIWETTSLMSEPAGSGWLAVTCHSPRMAEWLQTAISLENVEARSDGKRLLVPASRGFTLEGEVKSVITVVAKTVHYWDQHIAGT